MANGDGNLGGALVGLMGVAIAAKIAGDVIRGPKGRKSIYRVSKKKRRVNQFGL